MTDTEKIKAIKARIVQTDLDGTIESFDEIDLELYTIDGIVAIA